MLSLQQQSTSLCHNRGTGHETQRRGLRESGLVHTESKLARLHWLQNSLQDTFGRKLYHIYTNPWGMHHIYHVEADHACPGDNMCKLHFLPV